MLKFQNPKPTKSGESVMTIWNNLKVNWIGYKHARLEENFNEMRQYALKIRELQEDLGMKQAVFPELEKQEAK